MNLRSDLRAMIRRWRPKLRGQGPKLAGCLKLDHMNKWIRIRIMMMIIIITIIIITIIIVIIIIILYIYIMSSISCLVKYTVYPTMIINHLETSPLEPCPNPK